MEEFIKEFLSVYQPWYADDALAEGKFMDPKNLLNFLFIRGPKFGYLPNSQRSILIVHHNQLIGAQKHFQGIISNI